MWHNMGSGDGLASGTQGITRRASSNGGLPSASLSRVIRAYHRIKNFLFKVDIEGGKTPLMERFPFLEFDSFGGEHMNPDDYKFVKNIMYHSDGSH